MKVRSLVTLAGAVLVLALVFGCAEAPKLDMEAAQAAVQAAKAAEADRYAADLFKAVQDSVEAAVTAAGTAQQPAATNKEAAKAEADTLSKQLVASIASAKELMKKAPKGKEGRAALEMIQNDINTLEASVAEITNAFNGGDFLTAKDKAQAAVTKINSIIEELNTAISKVGGRR
ncbi:MAG: hypothetical protein AAB354_09050 [candidate division KSB1 bacterium]